MIYQRSSDDCGEAVARNAIARLYRREGLGLGYLENDCRSFSRMREALADYGISAKGYAAESIRAVSHVRGAIIALTAERGRSHFVIVRRLIGPLTVFFDPARGWRLMSRRKFSRLFARRILVCRLISRADIRPVMIIRTGEETALSAFGLAEAIIAAAALTGRCPFGDIGLICAGFAILALAFAHRVYLLGIGRRIDFRIGRAYLDMGGSRAALQDYERFRTEQLTGAAERSEVWGGLAAVVFLAWCSLEVLFALFLALGCRFLFAAFTERSERRLAIAAERSERNMALPDKETGNEFMRASSFAGRYAGLSLLTRILNLSAAGGLAALTLWLNGGFGFLSLISLAGLLYWLSAEAGRTARAWQRQARPLGLDRRIYSIPAAYRVGRRLFRRPRL